MWLVVVHRHGRIGVILLALIVIALAAYLIYRFAHRHPAAPLDERAPVTTPTTAAPSAPASAPASDAAPAAQAVPAPMTLMAAPARRARRPIDPGEGAAVEVHGLTKRFGENVAVDDVDLRVPRGSAFGYLGPNGAGKTTLMRTLLGLTRANAGTMSLLDVAVPHDRARALARVGAIVDEPRFHGHLTGRQNLEILAAARGNGAEDRIDDALERVGLAHRANDRVKAYSMGMRQRLGVAACLLGDPELLILDEPMNGLDPAGMQEMRTMIEGLVDEGRTVMLSSHLLDEVERVCDTVAIVDHGHVIRQGAIDELVQGPDGLTVRVQCGSPDDASRLIGSLAASVRTDGTSLTVTLPAGATRDAVADLNRKLVEGGIPVFGLDIVQASLEDWFLSVTSRIGVDQ